MSRRLAQARTYARLGPASIARVAAYRLGLKSGQHPVLWLAAPVAQPPFFRVVDAPGNKPDPNHTWDDSLWWFGRYRAPLPDSPPDWFSNPFCDAPQADASLDWWRIPDFGTGDIKGLWELSRIDWVVAWATTAACGDAPALERLNLWLADWADRNPPDKGPNWKCGQEASIRAMHLFVVTGVCLIGLLTVQLLRAQGCRVLAIDFDQRKLELAKQFGAEICNPGLGEDPVAAGMAFSRDIGVDAVIITASTKSNDPVTQAARMSRKRGRIILVGVTGLELNRADFYEKELSFQVSCSYGPGR